MNRARLAAAVMGMLATGALVAACGGGETSAPSPSATSAVRTSTRVASTATGEASTSTPAAATLTPAAGSSATPVTVATRVTEPTPPRPQPTQSAPPPPTQAPPPPTAPAGVALTVAAINTTFAPTRLTAPTGATLTVTLDNQDAAILHNFVLFNSSGDQLAETELFEGPGARSVTFQAPGTGSYPFTCTVHPREMRGTLTVQ